MWLRSNVFWERYFESKSISKYKLLKVSLPCSINWSSERDIANLVSRGITWCVGSCAIAIDRFKFCWVKLYCCIHGEDAKQSGEKIMINSNDKFTFLNIKHSEICWYPLLMWDYFGWCKHVRVCGLVQSQIGRFKFTAK